MRSVTTEVNSPSISPTETNELSAIISIGSGFQFFIIIEPRAVLAISGEYPKRCNAVFKISENGVTAGTIT